MAVISAEYVIVSFSAISLADTPFFKPSSTLLFIAPTSKATSKGTGICSPIQLGMAPIGSSSSFTYILSLIFLDEVFDYKFIISIVLIGAGIIVIGKSKILAVNNDTNSTNSTVHHQKSSSYPSFKSIGYALIASIGWAIGLVIIDYSTKQINQILITGGFSSIISNVIRFPFALLILILMVWRENRVTDSSQYLHSFKKPSQTWVILLTASIIGTSLGAYLYTEAARTAGAIAMSLIASASPLFSLPLTYWINKEKITKYGFLGVISTILGVVVILI